MTREIKFRAWDKKNKIMIDWNHLRAFKDGWWNNSQELPIMQFTGLHDKNGKEIYEGDILKHILDGFEPHELLSVYWDEELNGFSSHSLDKEHLYQTPIMNNEYEVIGNIYENPELLK
mgnify:CR=1 FL=1